MAERKTEMSRNDKKKKRKHNFYSRNKEVTRISDITAGDDKTESTVPPDHLALTREASLYKQAAIAPSMCTNSLYS